MTDKEKIKQEIERLKHTSNAYDRSRFMLLLEIEKFIDSLPEESDCEKKDYRERYEKLTQSDTFKSSYCNKSLGKEESTDEAICTRKSDDLEEEFYSFIDKEEGIPKMYNTKECIAWGVDIAHHFAEWQKDKMNLLLQTEYEKGLFDMKEEMMKNTVLETEILMDCDGDGIETPYEEWLTLEDTEIRCVPDGFKDGDIVKVILVKEDLP